jgi:hypothetical protein
MIVPQDLPQAPDKVFMLATPAHMLTKLHWELYQLRKSLTEKFEHIGHTHAPSYCAFNCAVTAWHLADWTWKAAAAEQRAHILACLNIKSSGQDDKDFAKFQAALRDKSRALHVWPAARKWLEAHDHHSSSRSGRAGKNEMGERTRAGRKDASW